MKKCQKWGPQIADFEMVIDGIMQRWMGVSVMPDSPQKCKTSYHFSEQWRHGKNDKILLIAEQCTAKYWLWNGGNRF